MLRGRRASTSPSTRRTRARRGDILQRGPIGGRRAAAARRGRAWPAAPAPIEADYLNGEIVLLGRLHGVPTPANETARRLVQRAARQGLQPGSMTPDEFLRAVTLGTIDRV